MEKTFKVVSPFHEGLLVMLLIAAGVEAAIKYVLIAYLKVGLLLGRWLMQLHRSFLIYPFVAVLPFCIFGPWVHYQQTALRVASERGNALAHYVAELEHESETRVFRTHFAFELALQSAHTREFRAQLARADAFKEFTSNGGPLWLQAQLIETALAKLDEAGLSREDQLVYLTVLAVECGFNPFALNPKSSAGGANQFVRSTGKLYNLSVESQLVMDKNITAGIQHFLANKRKIESDKSCRLQGLSGAEWIEAAFPLFYQLHHDGPNSDLDKGPSKKALKGIAVGKNYLEKAIPVMFSEEPPAIEPEDFHRLVAMRTDEVVAQDYEELEQQLGSYVDGMLNESAGEWFATLARWSS